MFNTPFSKMLNFKGIYTFGSPRVGDGTFKQIIECAAKRSGTVIARFRNNDDFVGDKKWV